MRLADLIQDLPLDWLVAGDAEVTDIATDSRAVRPGTLFMAREGWFVDSHQFVPDAIAAGATAIIVTRRDAVPAGCAVPVLLSGHEDRDLGLLADRFFGQPTLQLLMVGVTGTNGKTSVTWLAAHMLRALGERPALMGTVSYQFENRTIVARNTTPDGLTIHRFARECLDAGATALVMEVSSHGVELERIAGVAFDVVAFTNLTRDHLDFHKTFEAYRDAKAKLFTTVLSASAARGKAPWAVAMVDDEAGRTMLEVASDVSTKVAVSVSGADVDSGTDRCVRADIVARNGVEATTIVVDGEPITIPLFGDHNIANATLAAAIVGATGRDAVADALRALSDFRGIPGRAERAFVPRAGQPSVIVDYAHSDDAVARIAAAVAQCDAAPVVVLGCGGDRDATKRRPMTDAALASASRVVLTSDNPRSEDPQAILDAMVDGLSPDQRARIVMFVDRGEAIAHAISTADGAPVLLLGKGHETYQEMAGRRFHLDDREEARRAVAAVAAGRSTAETALVAGWSAERVAKAVRGVVANDTGRCIGGVSTDSRAVADAALFVALVGDRFDGHAFLAAAVAGGAAMLLVSDAAAAASLDASVVVVDDTVLALGRLASAILAEARRRRGGLRLIAVTGSNGKTTTKELMRALIAGDGAEVHATPGNFNNHIGLPLTVAALPAGTHELVLEMGANAPSDIGDLVNIAAPDVAVVTSIGRAHTEGLGGLDGVRRAKAAILSRTPRVAVLPHAEADGPAFVAHRDDRTQVVTFGGTDATISVSRLDDEGPVTLKGNGPLAGWAVSVPLALPGEHNATNLAAALLAVVARGGEVSAERMPDAATITAGLAAFSMPGGRLRRFELAGRKLIDDAYNANPDSVLASLRLLSVASGVRVAVLGDMLELGEASESMHEEIGRHAAALADVVVGVGVLGAHIARASQGHWASDPDSAAAMVSDLAPPGATILLKGSRGARVEGVIDGLRLRWQED